MLTKTLTPILLLTSLAAAAAVPNPAPGHHPPPQCGTCNPLSGQNTCHFSTSCISTGKTFHCACRAGYKVNGARPGDISRHFRLPFKDYEFLVFADPGEECNEMCDDWMLPPPKLCSEVKLQKHCDV